MRRMSKGHTAITKPKKPGPPGDWHRADIVAAVWKRGSSLQKIARHHGYYPTSLHLPLRRPWPKGERLIAEFLGTTPQQIWPSRYHPDGTPRSGRGERGLGRYRRKNSTADAARNVYAKGAA